MELIDEYIEKCECGAFECNKNDISDLYNAKGKFLYEDEEYEEAEKCFKKAIKYNPDNGMALLNLAKIMYCEMNEFEIAAKYFTRSAGLTDLTDFHYMQLGECYRMQGMTWRALHYFRKSLKVKPSSSTYESMGHAYVDYNLINEGRKYYIKVAKYEPDWAYIYAHIADTYRRVHEYEKAVKYFQKAFEMDEEVMDRNFIRIYAITLRCLGRLKEAKAAILIVVEKDKDNLHYDFYSDLAMICNQLGEFEEALQYYQKYSEFILMDNQAPDSRELLCSILCNLGRRDEALREMNKDILFDENRCQIMSMASKLAMGYEDGFYENWKKAVEYYVNDGDGVWLNALIELKFKYQLRTRSYKDVEYNTKELKPAIKKHKSEFTFSRREYTLNMFNNAMILIEKGKLKEALRIAEAGIRTNNCEHCFLGICTDCVKAKALILELMGQDKEALENYELILKYEINDLNTEAEVMRLKEKIQNGHLENSRD